MISPIQSVNDFVIKFANVNGTGSASANNLFAKAVFNMGVPVSPRNIFPSNIQGLPTWYEVRVNQKGYLGRRGGGVDIVVAMNPQSLADDVAAVLPGGCFVYDSTNPLPKSLLRDDIQIIGIPFTELCRQQFTNTKQRMLFKNVAYIGALAALLDIDFEVFTGLLSKQFSGKEHLVTANTTALELGYVYAKKTFECPIGIRMEKTDVVGNQILIDGNTASGLGCVYGGATVCGWYPITPSTSVVEAFTRFSERMRIEPSTGKKRFGVVQMEDELAAIGVVIGASWNGARAFTATSGPGLSLMAEFLGLAYFAEIPLVLINVQRGGPSTGMPTRTQQSDLLACAYASHGDTKHVLTFPANPKECFDFSADSFDLAERLQTPIIIMSDLELGMNDWLSEPLQWDDTKSYDRGKVLNAEQLDNIKEGDKFGRYLDIDDDGICYRTYPGTHPEKGAFFTRGTSRDRHALYTEEGDKYVDNMERLIKKHRTAATLTPSPLVNINNTQNKMGLIYYGTTDNVIPESLDKLQKQGFSFNTMRLRSYPFSHEVASFIDNHETLFIIEQNRDAQMRTLLINELDFDTRKMIKILHYDGMAIPVEAVVGGILNHLGTEESTKTGEAS
ncbi:MAG: 2-oxoacid:acceptor oxidoreductase subunit alpha [Cycloclasticus sp.]|nr:2-oxoacid:acceptor oxidoreductase subunit alpha [Cycloclasticus sp.]